MAGNDGNKTSAPSNTFNFAGGNFHMFVDSQVSAPGHQPGQANKPISSTQSDYIQRPTSPVKRVRQPISNLTKTETYKKIREQLCNQPVLVLHCHGVPGSGKSQIIRKVAEEFPFSDTEPSLFIKWHIQCSDSGHDVKEELEKLTKELRKNSYLHADEKYQTIAEDIKKGVACSLVEALIKCKVPALIIIEDPNEKSKTILSDLFRSLENCTHDSHSNPLHVYVTSRKKSSLISDEEIKAMKCFKTEQVQGFSEDEAVEYLNGGTSESNKEAARKVFQRFSGLPLGLQAAKGFCKKARISYDEYLEIVKEYDYDILEQEKENILNDYGNSATHVFQALIMPFQVTDESDASDNLQLKVLSCLSYLHYDRIPEAVFSRCCQILREKTVKPIQLKADTGKIISKLLDHNMCMETDEHEVTFHEVVVNAFRLNAHGPQMNDFNPLKAAIVLMSGLISKDMRRKEQANKMYKLRRHVQALLEHVNNEDSIFSGKDSLLYRALISHLFETVAAISLAESPTFEKLSYQYFQSSLEKLWKRDKDFSLIQKDENGKSVDDIAKYVVKESQSFSKSLPDNFILDYYAKTMARFDDEEISFLERRSHGNFSAVRKGIKFAKNSEIIRKLQDCKVFLCDEDLQPLFLAERLASILHSWSRVILYCNSETACADERCIWFSSLSHSISKECRNVFNFTLLSEHLSIKGGMIPLLIKQKRSTTHLKDAKEMCEEKLRADPTGNMYENGLLKEVDGPSTASTRLLLLRSLVQINARLLKDCSGEKIDKEADKRCDDLLSLASENLELFSSSIMCFIYCAKYYAGKKDYPKAIDCCEKYFSAAAAAKVTVRFNVFCWAVYNYGRVVFTGKLLDRKKDAMEKCDKALETPDVMSRSLHVDLIALQKSLDDMGKNH